MNTLPTKWYIPVTPLPTKWYIPVTPENYDEVKAWWLKQVEKSGWYGRHLDNTFIVLSAHPNDDSHYWVGDESYLNELLPSYKKITLEQFRQITNPTKKPMTKSIQITRDILNQYYDAATTPQRAYLAEHFKLDGTTTDEAIRGLYEMACSTWKPRIKKNHPDCFPEDSKHFDFSSRPMVRWNVSDEVADSLGMRRNFIQIRYNDENPETHYRSFYLTSEYDWKLVQGGEGTRGTAWALIPTKKKS